MLGAVTRFCSCSSEPLFIGFVEAGIALAVTFSFVIASPRIKEVATVILVGSLAGRHRYAMAEVKEIVGRIWKWVLLGIGVGALFHGFVPEAWVVSHLGG